MDDVVKLFRPVGQRELDLIENSGFTAFPPRLPEQPIFYPVSNEEYATQIARDWNAKFNTDRIGYVLGFEIRRDFIEGYETHVVDGSIHEEYWIPAEDLELFNDNIVGKIQVINKYESGV